LGENINIVRKNKEALLDASKEVGLELHTERTRPLFMSRLQEKIISYIKGANKSIETLATIKNSIHEEIMKILIPGL
jgi:hypothetical protein